MIQIERAANGYIVRVEKSAIEGATGFERDMSVRVFESFEGLVRFLQDRMEPISGNSLYTRSVLDVMERARKSPGEHEVGPL